MRRSTPRFAIVVHGGCGGWQARDAPAARDGVRAACEAGRRILAAGGNALDAVCAAVVVLEDDPIFNAGTGSTLTRDGEVEMDAAVMVGRGLRCGGVAALRRVKNPVLVARHVMTHTAHVLLAGEGALALAREAGFADHDPVTARSRERYRMALAAARTPTRSHDTVGTIALDATGTFAAATSTGGVNLKLPGRVGDSPIPGAGQYACDHAAAAATGLGELMLRTLATKSVCDRIERGESAADAARAALRTLPAGAGDSAGIIALDLNVCVGVATRGGVMPFAWFAEGADRTTVGMRGRVPR